MATNKTSDAALSPIMQTLYHKTFLERAAFELIHEKGAQMKEIENNVGKTVNFTRFSRLPVATTPLTEGSDPSESSLSTTTVSATFAEYGDLVKISRLLSLTDIDPNAKEKIELLGQGMGETLDTLVRTALVAGSTKRYAGGKVLSTVATSDIFSAAEVRKAVTQLKKNYAIPYTDLPSRHAKFIGKVGPDTSYDITGDSTWVNASIYDNGAEALYSNSIGTLHSVMFYEAANQYVQEDAGASSADVFSNFIHGKEAFGCIDLANDKPQLHIVPGNKVDSGNRTARVGSIAWAGSFVSKVLNSDWLIEVRTGSQYS